MLQTTFLSSIKHKKRMLIKQLTVSIDFHRLSFQTMEVNGYQQLFGYQNYYFVFNRKKKFGTTPVWSNMRVSKSWHFSFLEWTILTARETKLISPSQYSVIAEAVTTSLLVHVTVQRELNDRLHAVLWTSANTQFISNEAVKQHRQTTTHYS